MKTQDYVMLLIFVGVFCFSTYTLGILVDAKFASVETNMARGFCHCEENKKSS